MSKEIKKLTGDEVNNHLSDFTENEVSSIILETQKSERDGLMVDFLTGCKTPQFFSDDFARFIREADEKLSDLTLVMLDIDGLKNINDHFGHEAGDEVIVALSNMLLAQKESEYVYRYYGDQFTVLMPETEKESAFLVMESLRSQIIKNETCIKYSATISIGIATYPEDGARAADIIRKSEGAMFRAKNTGRNKICIAKDEKLVTKTSHYSVDQLKRLKALSESVDIVEASLMREALDDLLKKYDKQNNLSRNVLIVDDALFMRTMLKDLLKKGGIAVVGEAEDGFHGVELYNSLHPDFVILDILMPKMNGIDFLKGIKKNIKSKIIILSARLNRNTLIECVENGADACIVKPFSAETLLNAIHHHDKYLLKKENLALYKEALSGFTPTDIIPQSEIDKLAAIK